MGQKVNPIIFRVNNGNKRTWNSNWFAEKTVDYVKNVVDDLKIQNFFKKNASKFSVGSVNIERQNGKPLKIGVMSGKISLVIGKKGENIEQIEKKIKKDISVKTLNVDVVNEQNMLRFNEHVFDIIDTEEKAY
jgi:ribosomal protein S3